MTGLGTDVYLDNDFAQQTSGGAGQNVPLQPPPAVFDGITSIGQSLVTANSSASARSAISAAQSGSNSDITELLSLTLAVINTLRIKGFTQAATPPSLLEYPASKDFGVHRDTLTGFLYMAFNFAGTVYSVQML
jgi:hypothetical protein